MPYTTLEFTAGSPKNLFAIMSIVFLAERFRHEANAELDKDVKGFSPAAQAHLLAQAWPGNVRELRNTVRRAVLLSTSMITPKHLCQPLRRVRSM